MPSRCGGRSGSWESGASNFTARTRLAWHAIGHGYVTSGAVRWVVERWSYPISYRSHITIDCRHGGPLSPTRDRPGPQNHELATTHLARDAHKTHSRETPPLSDTVRLWFDVDTHHQTGGESWGVRRGGRHGKGDCQLRRYHRNKRQLHQQFVFSDRIQIQLSSGSSADRAVAVVEQQKRRDGSTYRGGEKRC